MTPGLFLNRNFILEENLSMLNSRVNIKGTLFLTLFHGLLGRRELRERVQKGQEERGFSQLNEINFESRILESEYQHRKIP